MIALVATTGGAFSIDLETGETEAADAFAVEPGPSLNLPRVIATAQSGSTIVALVAARPPLLVSHDAGSTWRESGRGLPPGRAVAISAVDPDLLLYAGRDRVFTSRDGGRFWVALELELPEIDSVALREA